MTAKQVKPTFGLFLNFDVLNYCLLFYFINTYSFLCLLLSYCLFLDFPTQFFQDP